MLLERLSRRTRRRSSTGRKIPGGHVPQRGMRSMVVVKEKIAAELQACPLSRDGLRESVSQGLSEPGLRNMLPLRDFVESDAAR